MKISNPNYNRVQRKLRNLSTNCVNISIVIQSLLLVILLCGCIDTWKTINIYEETTDEFKSKNSSLTTDISFEGTIPNKTKQEHHQKITHYKMMYTTDTVHLRKQPNKESMSKMIVPQYQIVVAQITDEKDEWYFVSCNDNEGWICSDYLRNYNKANYIDIPVEFYHQDLVTELITEFELDVDEYFFYGLMYVENRFGNNGESPTTVAKGLMQIMPSTWDSLYPKLCEEYPHAASYTINDATDKTSNIVMGMYVIKYLTKENNVNSTKNNSSRILTSYNRGTGGAYNYYVDNGTYSSSYSKNVLNAAEYIRTYQTWKEGM